jgi:hypothetical protein
MQKWPSAFLRHVQEYIALARPSTFVDSLSLRRPAFDYQQDRMPRQDADYPRLAGESAEEMAGKVTEQAFTAKAHQSTLDRLSAS